jgi:hypothetical protein
MHFVSTENGLKSAERITEALSSKSADSSARLPPSELNETFRLLSGTKLEIVSYLATNPSPVRKKN